MEKVQVLYIHGGMTFKCREDYLVYLKSRSISIEKKIKWNKDYLKNELEKDFHLVMPRMPLSENANYEDWKIYFERHFEFLNENVILIGFSLGAIFLSKYLSENKFPKKILGIYMIAPPFDNSLNEDDLVGGFELGEDLTLIEENCNNVKLLFSSDDDCVPINHAEKYKEKLKSSQIIIYENKGGHFVVEEFPELIDMLKEDLKRI